MRRTLAMAALALSLALTTAACGGDDDKAADLPTVDTTTSSSPSPTPTAEWSATTKPQRPQDELSAAGAQAFTQFAADTVLYVMATGDAPTLSAISDLVSCEDCRGWDDNFNNGKIVKLMIAEGPATYEPKGDPVVTDKVFYKVPLAMDIPRGTSVRKDSGKKIDTVNAARDLPFTADVRWKDDQWVLMRYTMG